MCHPKGHLPTATGLFSVTAAVSARIQFSVGKILQVHRFTAVSHAVGAPKQQHIQTKLHANNEDEEQGKASGPLLNSKQGVPCSLRSKRSCYAPGIWREEQNIQQ